MQASTEHRSDHFCIFTYLHAGGVGANIIVASSVTVKFTCTAPDLPIWHLNGDFAFTSGTCYSSVIKRAQNQTDNNTAILTINDNNDTCSKLNVYCKILIAQQYLIVHNTTLIFQG